MEISVVIATWNRRHLLQRTIKTLLEQTFGCEQYEIVVVVDGSTDGTAQFLRALRPRCNLVVLEQPNRGQAAARNAGVAVAQGTTVLFLDDDIICDPCLIAAHVNAHRDRRDRVVFGPTFVHEDSLDGIETDALRSYVCRRMQSLNQGPPQFPRDAMLASNSSVPTSLLNAVGGFDEAFGYSIEDIELGYRLWLRGAEFVYCNGAISHQVYEKTARTLIEHDAAQFGRNEVLLCRKLEVHYSYSMLTKIATGSTWKRAAAHCAAALPVSPDPLLRPVYAGLALLRCFPLPRAAALRLLRMREGIAAIRGAVQFIGSWEEFMAEFSVAPGRIQRESTVEP